MLDRWKHKISESFTRSARFNYTQLHHHNGIVTMAPDENMSARDGTTKPLLVYFFLQRQMSFERFRAVKNGAWFGGDVD